MRLEALLPSSDLDALLKQALPLKVLLGAGADDDRSLLLRDARALTFVPGQGVAISCTADIRWSVLGLTLPINLRDLSVLLTPQIAARGGAPALVFALSIIRADLAGVPAVIHASLVEVVNQALSMRFVELRWDFGKTFTRAFGLPPVLADLSTFNLGVGKSAVEVRADALVLSIELLASVTRS